MKKLFILAFATLALASCNDDDNAPTVDSSVPLFQNLKVEYNSTRKETNVSANFNKNNESGESVQLSGSSFITFNGQTPDYSDRGSYFYTYTFPGLEDITFVLARTTDEVFTNTVSIDDIDFLEILKQFTSISLKDGTTFVWVGKSVGEDETVEVRIRTKTEEYKFRTTETGNIGIDIKLPESASAGTAQFYVSRIKNLGLKESDKGAGGQTMLVYTSEKEITLE